MSKNKKVKRAPEIFGYIRVSTKEQNADRQLIAMEEYDIPLENMYIDKKSGKDFNEIYHQWRNKELTYEQAAKQCGFSVRTLYDRTAEWRKEENKNTNKSISALKQNSI